MGNAKAKGEKKQKKVEGEQKDLGRKEDGPIAVVLKLEMHCEDCAEKERQRVEGFEGVEAVALDFEGSYLTVIGKLDPVKLRGHVENELHKKVCLISPAIAFKKNMESSEAEGNEGARDQKPEHGKKQKEADHKNPNEPLVTSVTLKVRLHCGCCIERFRKQISEIKGVESVSIDSENDLVRVKGSIDVNSLYEFLSAKLKRGVEILTPKKDGGGAKEKSEKMIGNADVAKYNYPYHIEMTNAPKLFSDENPNAWCSIL